MRTRLLALLAPLFFLASALAERAPDERLPLWPDGALGPRGELAEGRLVPREEAGRQSGWLSEITHPTLWVYRPRSPRPTGSAVVILPGGGYAGQAIDKEGHSVARWMADRGVVGVVASYRCGGGEHRHPVPLNDAQRALQWVRSHAERLGIDSNRIGVLGFSAGGHLAATAATDWLAADPASADPVRRVASRPDFAVLVYPVISMREGISHPGSRRRLLGESPDESLVASLSADERVGPETPPALIIHSVDDQSVSMEHPLRFCRACRENGVPVEMHLYESGGHGYGLWAERGTVAQWPAALERWLVDRGLADEPR